MRKRNNLNTLFYFLFLTSLFTSATGSSTIKLSGYITDKSTGRPIPDANVLLLNTNLGSASQEGGYYYIDQVKPGVYSVEVQVMGYQKASQNQINLQQNSMLNFSLQPAIIEVAPVMITATLTEHLKSHITVSADVLTSVRMKQLNGSTSGEIVESVIGLYSKTSDGLAGIQTPSIRGSDANQVVILMDGIRLNTAQGGGVDLNQIPLTALERIEIVRGGHSALIGADAVGGAIHLLSKQSIRSKGFAYGIYSTIGSFGMQNINIYGSHQFGPVSLFLNLNRIQTDGDFTYVDPSTNRETVRGNNDFKGDNLLARVECNLNTKNKIRLIFQNIMNDKGNAGSVNLDWMGNPSLTPNSRSENKNQLLTIQSENQLTDDFRLKEQLYYHAAILHYTDPGGWAPVDDTHENRTLGVHLQGQLILHRSLSLITGLEIRQDRLKSSAYTPDNRNVQGLFIQPEIRHEVPLGSVATQWAWIPSIRWDHYSDVSSNLSPKLGLLISTGEKINLAVRGNVGQSFRVPNFNDLYWPEDFFSKGNPDLNPETSINDDIGFEMTWQGPTMVRTGITYYNNHIQDLIQWAPTQDNANFWMPQNVGKAEITGIESSLQLNLLKNIGYIRLAHTQMKAMDLNTHKKLIYRPDHKTDVTAGLNWGFMSVNLNVRFVSERFADSDNMLQLDSYEILNGNIAGLISPKGFSLQMKLEAMNLFDKSIYILDGYPFPGREFRFTLGISH